MEETFVVGAFLSFDETGGNYGLRTQGVSFLPQLLETQTHFHASLLKKDTQILFGKESTPNFDEATKKYLKQLLADLGAKDPVRRCAAMVAFEMHAGQMIQALWDSVVKLHPSIKKESLTQVYGLKGDNKII